jgi:hypothetical protein
MKPVQLLILCVLTAFATLAFSAQTGRDCEIKSKQVSSEKRDAFLKSCLAQASAPANVQELTQQNKRLACEQNAKNLKLNPGNKPGYVEECVHKNEAAAVAKSLNAPQSIPPAPQAAKSPSKPAHTGTHKSATEKPAKTTTKNVSCSHQAKEKGLKGAARKQFMQDCGKS